MLYRISHILLLAGLHFLSFAQLTPQEAVLQMQKGINLGNTLEPPYEGGWNNPIAQEYYFDLYRQAGFTCVRIPVRWDEHTQDVSPYHIDEAWLQRVEELLDWGLERDLFVIVNAHHDDWIKQNYTHAGYRARFDSIWSQIAVRFRDKSEKLIFEILNEPHGLTKEQNDEMHGRILSIIRKTNPTRIVIFQGHNWGGSDELIAAAIPDDPFVIGSFHSYDPYAFGLLGEGTWGSAADINVLNYKFKSVKDWSDQHHVPVFLGEFGSLGSCDYNSRMKHYRTYVELARKNGFAYCAWDDGGDFRILERAAGKWNEVKDILLHTTAGSPKNLNLKIVQDTIIQLTWTNVNADQDSISIERRITNGSYAKIATLSGDTNTFFDYHPVEQMYNHYRIIAHNPSGIDLYSQPMRIMMPAYVPKVRQAFLGEPARIPGIVEAEDYDMGGEGFTYHDADPGNIAGDYRPDEGVDIYSRPGDGYHIGNALPGEWVEYSVVVEKEDIYQVYFQLAAIQGGGTFKVRIGDVESGIITAPGSGSWLTTKSVSDTLVLAAGEQIMRFTVIEQPIFNIDRFVFTLLSPHSVTASNQGQTLRVYLNRNREIVVDMPDENAAGKIEIYNMTGSLLYSGSFADACPQIATERIQPGLYILNIVTHDSEYSLKIMLP
jgi:hypothetical protein